MGPAATASSVLVQLDAVLVQLNKIREARGWSIRDCARMLDIHPGALVQWPERASGSTTLRLLDAHARQVGYTVRLVLIEDNPGKPGPWRQRMPHGSDPTDAHAMTETWRLQQRLRHMRIAAGRASADFAETLGIHALALWRLENSPTAIDGALTNVLVLARFFGYRIMFRLTPLSTGR
jgi:transcriptional regulator with XRE-family HTH domain